MSVWRPLFVHDYVSSIQLPHESAANTRLHSPSQGYPAHLAEERCIPRRVAWTGKEQYSSASTVTSWRRFAQPPEPRLRLSSLPAVVFVTSAKADGLPATARSSITCTSNRAPFIGSGALRCPHRGCSRRLHEREQRCSRGCTCMRRGSARVAAATGLVVFVVVVLVVVLVASGAGRHSVRLLKEAVHRRSHRGTFRCRRCRRCHHRHRCRRWLASAGGKVPWVVADCVRGRSWCQGRCRVRRAS